MSEFLANMNEPIGPEWFGLAFHGVMLILFFVVIFLLIRRMSEPPKFTEAELKARFEASQ